MKKLIFVSLIIGLISGCAISNYQIPLPQIKVFSTIPWNSAVITVVNGVVDSSDLVLDVIHDGVLIWSGVRPGQYRTIRMSNYSGTAAQTTVTVVAKYSDGRLAGTASRSFYVSGYYRQSEVWTVGKWDIH